MLKRRRNCAPLIGLIGRAVASGLGYLNYDLAEQGAVDAWLVVDPPQLPALDLPAERCRVERLRDMRDEAAVRRWLSRLDWVVWAESSPLVCVVRLAQQMGVRTACIPMWEWTSPTASWLRCVDLLICPVRHAYGLFQEWRRRFDFRWRVAYFPWPVAVERFPFRLRQRRRRCVFINGRGGAWAGELETDRRLGPRKGLDLVLAAARLTPEVSWTIFTQAGPPIAPPPNVEVREGPVERAALYEEGDVCVQPSRWEGLGLPLLECQAAGMPLVTVDAAPMNEHRPLRCAAPEHWTWGSLVDGQPLRIPEVSPEALAHTIRELQDEEIRAGSEAAHHWIRRERSWRGAVETWRRLFASSVCETL